MLLFRSLHLLIEYDFVLNHLYCHTVLQSFLYCSSKLKNTSDKSLSVELVHIGQNFFFVFLLSYVHEFLVRKQSGSNYFC